MVAVSLFSVEISRSNSASFTRTGDIMSPPPLLHILLLVLIVALAVLAQPRSVTCLLNDSGRPAWTAVILAQERNGTRTFTAPTLNGDLNF